MSFVASFFNKLHFFVQAVAEYLYLYEGGGQRSQNYRLHSLNPHYRLASHTADRATLVAAYRA